MATIKKINCDIQYLFKFQFKIFNKIILEDAILMESVR